MELRLSKEDVENILLQWAEKEWNGCFNTVVLNADYRTLTSAELSFEKPEATDSDKLKAA